MGEPVLYRMPGQLAGGCGVLRQIGDLGTPLGGSDIQAKICFEQTSPACPPKLVSLLQPLSLVLFCL